MIINLAKCIFVIPVHLRIVTAVLCPDMEPPHHKDFAEFVDLLEDMNRHPSYHQDQCNLLKN